MNQNNDIASLVLACNTNINSADRSAFYYITYYQMKHNQTEEKLAYLVVCEGLSRRIKYQLDQLKLNPDIEVEPRDLNRPDSSEGLKRILSAMYAHTSNLVFSAPMAHLLLSMLERFEFSHDYDAISLPHLIDWYADKMDKLFFVLRSTKIDGKTVKIPDYYINDVLLRPQELERLCCYEVKMYYEKARIPAKKKKAGDKVCDDDDNTCRESESKVRFFFFEEHPSSKIMCMKKKKHFEIPQISSTKLFPNISQLEMRNRRPSSAVIKVREEYAQMALLLFYPFRTRSDLKQHGSFWNKYRSSVHDGTFWSKGLEILQNIQDINYNCTQLTKPIDPITATTTLKEHEKDKELARSDDNEENTVTIENIEALLKTVDSHSHNISDPDINKRRLKIVADKVLVPPHTLPNITSSSSKLKDMFQIPTTISEQFLPDSDQPSTGNSNGLDLTRNGCYLLSNPLVIEMITGKIFQSYSDVNWDNEDPFLPNSIASRINLEFIIKSNQLDIKQAAAFEILACSYILLSLDDHKVTQDEINKLYYLHDYNRADKTAKLKHLKDILHSKGGTTELVMFLSGMGGSGKSTVIKAFHKFSKHISNYLQWPYDQNNVKITAMTGSAASLLDDANTLHMTACLNKSKIIDEDQLKWVTTKMLFIDEVSFMTPDNLVNLDKKLRHLTQKSTVLFGEVGIIFVGDFHQLNPVKGTPLYKANNVQFRAINRAVFLNRSHRFKQDPVFGNILRKFRNGEITEDDILFINSRYIEEDDVTLPEPSKLRYACSTNQERNAVSTSTFLRHLQATHTVSDDPSTECPNHTIIIKGTLRYGRKKTGMIGRNLRNMIYDTCGDADVENSEGK